ncbi:endonuclease domain-containing protein [archaeon]|nr:endonuclease domain-containing protein [archaeon]
MTLKAKRVKRICLVCGKEFEILESRLRWGGTYCCQKCQKNRANKINKVCIICGGSYQIWPYQILIKAPTCSIKCTKIYLKQKYNKKVVCPICKKEFWTSKKNPLQHCNLACRNKSYIGKNTTGEYRICPICKLEFYVSRARLERGEGIYCSRKCRDNSPNKSVEQRIKEGGLVELYCAWCGKKFVRSRFFKDIQKYCSQECAKRSRNETAIETKVRVLLEKFGVYFEQEKAIKNPKGKWYFVDFFIPPKRVIECDGKFWHNPKNFPIACKRNLVKRKYLRKRGYKLYIFKEEDINRDVESLIKHFLEENPNIILNSKLNSKTKPRKRTIISKICKNCGKEFETIPSRVDKHHFCNRNCLIEYHRIKLKCQNCGKLFSIKRSYKKRRFCTVECQKENTKRKNEITCLNCGKIFSPNPADRKRGKAKFCSRDCVLLYNEYAQKLNA